MNANELKDMFLYVAQKMIGHKDYLTEVDSATGDGDHGIGITNGFQAVLDKLQNLDTDITIKQLFSAIGKAMLTNMGGASGALFGTLFGSAAKIAPDHIECREKDFVDMFRSGLEGVKQLGKAERGDKTMVDALEPAVIALEEHKKNGYKKMITAARMAAWQGVEATRNMKAKFGRSKSLMERAIGFQDAGATSVALIMDAMEEYFSKQS